MDKDELHAVIYKLTRKLAEIHQAASQAIANPEFPGSWELLALIEIHDIAKPDTED